MLLATPAMAALGWVPNDVRLYLAHTEHGTSIRALAREAGCHASTVMRQIRRYEQRRDDPLIDHALRRLGALGVGRGTPDHLTGGEMKHTKITRDSAAPTDTQIEKEAARVLRRLAEPGACLAIAQGMENAVVVREGADGQTVRTAVVGRAVAEAMALRDWIAAAGGGKIARYHLTNAGRAKLKKILADGADRAAPSVSDGGRVRYGLAESPLLTLARRRDKDGTPFLTEPLLAAGERLREDFELAQMGGSAPQDWDRVVTQGTTAPTADPKGTGPEAARARVAAALGDLGPGLGDVVLRCCCQLEGMEAIERRMGWAARSGKIVLRIALQRLRRYYDEIEGKWSPMIG
ncbi:DUF6456 domain-containing protein [Oceaniglobus ichthyenteri]|uniref:DUF6456 domain-containing protein n=1 Tax=Oceaniglobus ichthyenteri TaxID=2136177 RepID=UPI000D3477F7|nr:DUF6456 domain-containing protein [Oceaniglobus ichthyenteri]